MCSHFRTHRNRSKYKRWVKMCVSKKNNINISKCAMRARDYVAVAVGWCILRETCDGYFCCCLFYYMSLYLCVCVCGWLKWWQHKIHIHNHILLIYPIVKDLITYLLLSSNFSFCTEFLVSVLFSSVPWERDIIYCILYSVMSLVQFYQFV